MGEMSDVGRCVRCTGFGVMDRGEGTDWWMNGQKDDLLYSMVTPEHGGTMEVHMLP